MKIKSLIMVSVLALSLQMTPFVFAQSPGAGGNGQNGRWEKRLANLSPEDRQKVEAAREKAMQDPAVQAAREKMREASREFREAMHAAMLKADPSIKPILDKMHGRHRNS
jgi:Spy/CpxP family protein refolding chaperone